MASIVSCSYFIRLYDLPGRTLLFFDRRGVGWLVRVDGISFTPVPGGNTHGVCHLRGLLYGLMLPNGNIVGSGADNMARYSRAVILVDFSTETDVIFPYGNLGSRP